MTEIQLSDAAVSARRSGITSGESIPLLTAWAMRLASDLDIRALVIKGPIAAQQGLREPRSSNDVDVWIDPARHRDYCVELERLGWVRHFDARHSVLRPHSFTMRHDSWACELDVHEYFPGFFAEQHTPFDHIWERRTRATIAGGAVWAPDRVGGAAILALHCLRDLRPGTPVIELEFLQRTVRADFDARQRDELAALAAACGANETLRPFFAGAEVRAIAGTPATVAQLEDWRVVTTGHFAPSVAWVDALRKARLSAWPVIAWHAFWLTEPEIRRVEPNVGSGWPGLMWGRIRRLGRGLKMLPRGFRIVVLRREH